MNPAKAQVKIAIYDELTREYEKREDDARVAAARQEGARDALKAAQRPIGDFGELMKKEMEEGGLEGILGEPLKVLEWAMKWNRRAVGSLENLSNTAEVARIGAEGRVQGLRVAKEHTFKLWKAERERVQAFIKEQGGADGEADARGLPSEGRHPGPSLKAQRGAESAENSEEAKPPEKPKDKPEAQNRPKAATKRKAAPKTSAKKSSKGGTKKKR